MYLVLACLLLLLFSPVSACPFCSAAPSDLFTKLRDARAVALVRKVGAQNYRIESVLKGKVKVGKVVVAGGPESQNHPYTLLSTAGAITLPYWTDEALPINETELAFVKSALQIVTAGDQKQWDFAASNLESSSREVSEACYNILAKAPLAEVKKRGARVGQARLLAWVKNAKIPEQRRALYMLMALQGLKPTDTSWLRTALFQPPRNVFSPLLPPLIMGYLQLTGPNGIPEVEQTFMKPDLSLTEASGATSAFVVLGQSAESPSLRSAARARFRNELKHPKRGLFAVPPLAVWKDYTVAATVEKLAFDHPKEAWFKVAVVRYFRSFATPEAHAALVRLKAVDKELVEKTTAPYQASDLANY